ncbi:helix-turn-helix domain-containing protein [Faecalibacillus faecis]|uniref:helix-turn-helix domain-containing protein n=1 Tax=Faecalibacillus faecis TaxID=1982628 RepID=UPI0038705CA6
MFIYEDNEQLKRELKKIVIDSGLTQKEVSERMECKPQQYTNIVNKENLAFRDVKRIANAIGLNVRIEFVPVGNVEK